MLPIEHKIIYRINMNKTMIDLNEFLVKMPLTSFIQIFIREYLYGHREYIKQALRLTPEEQMHWDTFLEAKERITKLNKKGEKANRIKGEKE